MPTPSLPQPSPEYSLDDVKNYLIGLIRNLNWLLSNMDTLNVNRLDAKVVNTGTLNANNVTISASSGGNSLTIDNAGIRGNNGSYNTINFDLATGILTIIGALFQSATGYPRVEVNSSSKLLAAYQSATQYIQLLADVAGQPEIYLQNGTTVQGALATSLTALLLNTSAGKGDIQISSGQQLNLAAQGAVNLAPTGNLQINGTNGYSGSFSVVTGVNFTTQTTTTKTITVTKGIVTNVV